MFYSSYYTICVIKNNINVFLVVSIFCGYVPSQFKELLAYCCNLKQKIYQWDPLFTSCHCFLLDRSMAVLSLYFHGCSGFLLKAARCMLGKLTDVRGMPPSGSTWHLAWSVENLLICTRLTVCFCVCSCAVVELTTSHYFSQERKTPCGVCKEIARRGGSLMQSVGLRVHAS